VCHGEVDEVPPVGKLETIAPPSLGFNESEPATDEPVGEDGEPTVDIPPDIVKLFFINPREAEELHPGFRSELARTLDYYRSSYGLSKLFEDMYEPRPSQEPQSEPVPEAVDAPQEPKIEAGEPEEVIFEVWDGYSRKTTPTEQNAFIEAPHDSSNPTWVVPSAKGKFMVDQDGKRAFVTKKRPYYVFPEYWKLSDIEDLKSLGHPQMLWLVQKTGVHPDVIKYESIKAYDWFIKHPSRANNAKDLLQFMKRWLLNMRKKNCVPFSKCVDGRLLPVGDWQSTEYGTYTIITGVGKMRQEYTFAQVDYSEYYLPKEAERMNKARRLHPLEDADDGVNGPTLSWHF
jgi:hypothetical protein